jgi:hypothetical protein
VTPFLSNRIQLCWEQIIFVCIQTKVKPGSALTALGEKDPSQTRKLLLQADLENRTGIHPQYGLYNNVKLAPSRIPIWYPARSAMYMESSLILGVR